MLEEQQYPLDAEQQATTLLEALLRDNPLPETPDEEKQGIYRVDSAAAKTLHCIGLIRDGKITPYIELDQIPEPVTPGEKMHYMTFIAHTILGGLMEALLLMEQRYREAQQNQDDKGEGSWA